MADELKDALFMLGELYFKHRKIQDENAHLSMTNGRLTNDIQTLVATNVAQQEEVEHLRELTRIPEPSVLELDEEERGEHDAESNH